MKLETLFKLAGNRDVARAPVSWFPHSFRRHLRACPFESDHLGFESEAGSDVSLFEC